jgi:hypothetical protein
MKVEQLVKTGDKIQAGDIWRNKQTGKRDKVSNIVVGMEFYECVAKTNDLIRMVETEREVQVGEMIEVGDYWLDPSGETKIANYSIGEELLPHDDGIKLMRPIKPAAPKEAKMAYEVLEGYWKNQSEVIRKNQIEINRLKDELVDLRRSIQDLYNKTK